MDVIIFGMTVGMVVEITAILLFLLKTKNKTVLKYKMAFATAFSVLAALQIFIITDMLMQEGVFKSVPPLAESSSIQNPASETLLPLLQKQDFPDHWKWIRVSTQQPGSFPWKGSPIDSAESVLIAQAPQYLLFRHNVRVFHRSALYDSAISEADFMKRISYGVDDETAFVPRLNKAGKYFYAICNEGFDSYACEVSMGYEHLISYISVITPQELGGQFTIDLLNSSIKAVDQKLK